MARKINKDTRQEKKPYFSKPAWAYYYRFLQDDKYKLIGSSLGFVVLSYFILPILYLVKYIFDVAIPQKQIEMFIWIGLAILALRVLNSVFTLSLRNLNIKIISKSIYSIRENLTSKIFSFSRSYYTSEDTGILHTQIVQDTERISRMGISIIAGMIPSVLNIIGMCFILIYLNWYLFLIILMFFPILYFSNKYMGKIARSKIYDYQRAFEGFSKGTMFLLRFMDLIKIQSVEVEESEKHQDILADLREKTTKRSYFNALNAQVQKVVIGLIGILILIIGGIAVARDMMTLGDLMAFYLAASQLQARLNNVSNSFSALVAGNESMVTLHKIADQKFTEPYSGKEEISFHGEIRMDSISFKYDDVWVLRDLNLEINRGKHLAIIGPNGAGKSTIVNLMLGFYKPQTGMITAEEMNFVDIDFKYFRKQIGVVTQHPPLIPGTILENIIYGSEGISRAKVVEVCRLSLADSFIGCLPAGYDTSIGEDGVLLSGGERQKIAIARALLRKPGLLILDEPTNHLDELAVSEIMKNIGMLSYNPAILIISHDMGVVNQADEIFILENGTLMPFEVRGPKED